MNSSTLLESPQDSFSEKHIFNYARLLYRCVLFPVLFPDNNLLGNAEGFRHGMNV